MSNAIREREEICGKAQENQTALLQEIRQKLEEMEQREKRRRVRTLIAMIVAVAAVFVLSMMTISKVQAVMGQYETAAGKIQELTTVVENLEVDKIQGAVNFIASVDYEKLMELSDVLSSLDAKEIQGQLDQVRTMMAELEKLNMNELVENINLISEKIQPIINFMKR